MVIKEGDRLFDFFVHAFLIATGIIFLFPVLYVVSVSLTSYEDYMKAGGVFLFPKNPTLTAYTQYLKEPYVWESFGTTLLITLLGTALNILGTVLMAYPLSKTKLVFKRFFDWFVLIPMLMNGGMIPTYLIVRYTGLMNTIWAYMIPSLIWSHVLMITRTFFARMDSSLQESAYIDGAGEMRTLFGIVLPLSMPIIVTIGLMYAVSHWNEYFAGYLYISTPALKSMQVFLRELLERNTEATGEHTVATKSMQMAGIVISAIPIVAVYPFLQRFFTKGMMLGAVKG